MPVHVIKANKNANQQKSSCFPVKLRVAAYARVSTASDAQETSYEAQCTHYTNYISSNPSWTFAGIYADEGISGTSTKNREQFNKMIEDCKDHKIDMIITKSISRWARNTIDSLQNIRLLKDLGIYQTAERSRHPSSLREREHQHDGRTRRSPHHDHVLSRAAGVRFHLQKRPDGDTVPDAAGEGKGEYELLSRVYTGRRRLDHHSRAGQNRETYLPGIP